MTVVLVAIAAIIPPPTLWAQDRCSAGAAFGVTSYQCASCAIEQKPGARTRWTFHAEPLILQVGRGSMLRVGDVLEAVDGKPITTAAGGWLFVYPGIGDRRLTVRRAGSRVVLVARVSRACTDSTRGDSTSSIETQSAGTPGSPPPAGRAKTNRFGFAVACAPSCTRKALPDGREYWSFDDYPPVIAVDDESPASRGGLRMGDVVTAVNGASILEPEAALGLMRSERATLLRLTVRRADGTSAEVRLRAR